MKQFPNISIRTYKSEDREAVEKFRQLSLKEGNNSLAAHKYDPDSPLLATWLLFIDRQLASISACESSWYTGDPEIALRLCRYHILKKFRHCNAGFRMLPLQLKWAKEKGYKVMYWTHDVDGKTLNSLYQNKKRMPGKGSFFDDPIFKKFKLRPDLIFKVSPKSDFLQFIYQAELEDGYIWNPKTNVIKMKHGGKLTGQNKVLEIAKNISYS